MRPFIIRAAVLHGVDADLVEFRVATEVGDGWTITGGLGLAEDRIGAAVRACFPRSQPTHRLVLDTPATLGRGSELAATLAMLTGLRVLPKRALERTVAWAEVMADGELRPAAGAVAVAEQARAAGLRLVVARDGAASLSVVPGLEVVAAASLTDLVAALRADRADLIHAMPPTARHESDFELAGFARAKRAIEVAVAGGLHVMLVGPPSAERVQLLRWVGGLMPDLDGAAQLEAAKVRSIVRSDPSERPARPPLRMPHSTASVLAMFGGGTPVRPGEVTLAHRGVLALDDAPEFGYTILDTLAEVMRSGEAVVVRPRGIVHYPARFLLALGVSPCPCGQLGQPNSVTPCQCSRESLDRYHARLGAISRHVALQATLDPADSGTKLDQSSAAIRRRIALASARRSERQGASRGFSHPARRLLGGELHGHAAAIAAVLADLDERGDAIGSVGTRYVAEALELTRRG